MENMKKPVGGWEHQHPRMSEDTPVATWCSPGGRVSCVICVAERVGVGSRDFLRQSEECNIANGTSVDVCKTVPEPGHAGTHPHPLAHAVPCHSIV